MTTKTSSRKLPGWWTTYVDTLKRNRGVFIFSLLLMLAAPLHPILLSTEIGLYTLFSFHYHGIQNLLLGISGFVPVILSVIAPFMVFHYLHNRRAIDLYHALPISRMSLFLGKFLSGLTMVMLPTLIGHGSAVLIAATVRTYDRVAEISWQITLLALCLYVFTVFVIVCCGTVWESILYGVGLMIAILCIGYSVPEFATGLYGYASGDDLSNILLSVTPFYYLFRIEQSWNLLCLIPLITAGALFGLSVLLYQNRKSENTGSAFAYRFLFHIISVFIVIAAVLFIYIWSGELISALFLGFLGYFVMSVIANRGFKRLIPVLLRDVGIIAVIAGFIVTFHLTGGFGYETRIPALEQIESVTFCGIEVGDYISYMRYAYQDENEKIYREQENIKLVRELHQELLADKDSDNWNDINATITMQYQLKNGSTLQRSYHQVSEKGFRKVVQLNQSQEFLMQKYPFLSESFSYGLNARAVITFPFSEDGEAYAYENLGIAADEVAAALRKDILARPAGFETAPNADFVGKLAIFYPSDVKQKGESLIVTESDMTKPSEQVQTSFEKVVMVYECDRNILELLEKRGKLTSLRDSVTNAVTAEQLRLSVYQGQNNQEITSRVSNSGYYYDKYSSTQSIYLISDPEDRAFLIKHLQPVYYSDSGCDVIMVGERYCFLLPQQYRFALQDILSRAAPDSSY